MLHVCMLDCAARLVMAQDVATSDFALSIKKISAAVVSWTLGIATSPSNSALVAEPSGSWHPGMPQARLHRGKGCAPDSRDRGCDSDSPTTEGRRGACI